MPILMMLRIGLPVWPFHSPDRICVREAGHPVEHLVHLGDDVDPVHDERGPLRHAQGDVQHRAVLGHVDPLAREHGVPVPLELRLLGQLDQEAQGLVGDPVFRIVEVEPDGLRAEPLAPGRILGEELAEMAALDLGEWCSARASKAGQLPQRCNVGTSVSPLWAIIARTFRRPRRSAP